MTSSYALSAYQQTAVTAIYDKERLVVMVYEGIMSFLRQAREGMEEGQMARKGEAISTVIALLTELECALDWDSGGDIAANLADLYQWMMGRITEANLRNNIEAMAEVEAVAAQLLEGFRGAAQQMAGGQAMPEAPKGDAGMAHPDSKSAGAYTQPAQGRKLNRSV